MNAAQELIARARESRRWDVSFECGFYEGPQRRCDWPGELPADRSLRFALARQESSAVPFRGGTIDYLVACLREETALTRGIAIVHPDRAEDCFAEVLYGLLLHLDLLPAEARVQVRIPSSLANYVAPCHIDLVAGKNSDDHPAPYRVSPDFRVRPHPLSVVPDEDAEETILCSRLFPREMMALH